MTCPFSDKTSHESKILKLLLEISLEQHVPVIPLLHKIQQKGHFTEAAESHIKSVLDGCKCCNSQCLLNEFAEEYCGIRYLMPGDQIGSDFSAMLGRILVFHEEVTKTFDGQQVTSIVAVKPKLYICDRIITLEPIAVPDSDSRPDNCCWYDWVTEDSVRSEIEHTYGSDSVQLDAGEMLKDIYHINRDIFDGYAFLSISTIDIDRQYRTHVTERTRYRKLADGVIVPEWFIVMVHDGLNNKEGHWTFYKSVN